ncbi:MAG: tRNA (N(6)-L-threonylcarbamoyladenosine(37)-C(2))-methylthiotransferase MtaB, partial [Flavobacterium sp.]
YMHGFTKNYVKVRAKYDPIMVNELKAVKLSEMTADGEVEVTELETAYVHH